MAAEAWPQRLEDGTAVVAVHVEGQRPRIREHVEVLVAQWVASEQVDGHAFPEGLIKLPTVEPCDERGADVVLESRGNNPTWGRVVVRLEIWMMTHTRDLRAVAYHDRIGGETRKPVIIGA